MMEETHRKERNSMAQKEWIMVEFNGTRKTILTGKLPEAQKMTEEMYQSALKAGYPENYAKEHFTLRIVKDEE